MNADHTDKIVISGKRVICRYSLEGITDHRGHRGSDVPPHYCISLPNITNCSSQRAVSAH